MNRIIRKIVFWGIVLIIQLLLLFYFTPTEKYVPYIYPILLIGLPLKISRINRLWIAFFLGLFIDIFCNSFGVHTFSAVFLVQVTPYISSIFTRLYGDETEAIHPGYIDWPNYFFIVLTLLLTYHLLAIMLWEFSVSNLWEKILKVLYSSVYALGICIVITMFSIRPQKDNDE